jgi:protein SCO1/2
MSRRLRLILAFAGACTHGVGPAATVADEVAAHDDHRAHHEAIAEPARYTRTIETYEVPDLTLIDQDGHEVELDAALASSKPVVLNFVFTTCTTICPVMTATFSRMQGALGSDAGGLRLVTISVDPEFDTPEVLKRYAARYGSAPQWRFLTGDAHRIATVLRAFRAYYGSKMNHRPLTFLRIPGEARWVRIEGLVSVSDLAREYRRLIGRDG